jgi:hypothetical protein
MQQEDTMTPQEIQAAVAFLRMRGYRADPTGPDRWHVRITFPHFPHLTIDEQVSSTLLVALSDALRPFQHRPVTYGDPQRGAETRQGYAK